MKRKKIRPLGDILLELEPLILEIVEKHDLQHGDVLNLVHGYLQVHCPGAKEEYEDGDPIIFHYGPKRG